MDNTKNVTSLFLIILKDIGNKITPYKIRLSISLPPVQISVYILSKKET